MILIFDLDDTLYKEINFVKSGFHAVDDYFAKEYGLPSTYKSMLDIFFQDGRGAIFNKLLKEYHIFTKKTLQKCISIYRYHQPNITLDNVARRCLLRFSEYHKYIVTDGNRLVQSSKINALGIKKIFTGIYITRNYGLNKEKPSPYCFQKIKQKENVNPSEIIYIGDNIEKDFVGIKPLGFRTVRIKLGRYKDVILPDEYEAEFVLESLDDLDIKFIRTLT
jgi:putative hydrolase of the HAD superfamily